MKVIGAGSRCLILPGNDLSAGFYQGLADELARRGLPAARVTLPGCDGEPALPRPGWDALVEAVLPLVPEVLIGHSLGALLSLLLAARAPPLLRRLVLLEPAIFPSRAIARLAARAYQREVVDGDRNAFSNWNGGQWRLADPARFPAAMLALYTRARAQGDPSSARALFQELPRLYPLPYARVRVPTLLLLGARSGWRSRLLLTPLRFRLPDVTTRTLAGAAHWIANEQDAAAAAAIAAFLDSRATRQ